MFGTTGCGEAPHVTNPISPMTIFIGDPVTYDLSDHFADADQDELTYGATSSDPAVVTASVTGTTMLQLVPKAKGEVEVVVTATDAHGTAKMLIEVTVGNRAPAIVNTETLERYVTQTGALVVSDYFADPDGDEVTYAAKSSKRWVVEIDLAADTLRYLAVARGEAEITVTATDTDGLRTDLDIPVIIGPMPQRVALEFLYDAAGGSGWANDHNWGTDADVSTWYGVEVDEQGRVVSLSLGNNNLAGTIAPQLAELDSLKVLNLESNRLEGNVPVQFIRLSLSELHLTDNEGLAGEIPAELRQGLFGLDVLLAGGTDLCAPNDDVYRRWLDRIRERRVRMCEPVPPKAHMIQAAQSPVDTARKIPLVGGKQALLRVFVTSSHSTHEGIPPVRATFYVDDEETYTVTYPGKSDPIPVVVGEESLRLSANVVIPGDVIRPDLEMVIEIDPEGTLDEELDVAARLPEDGRFEYRVYDVPTFDLTVIPFLWKSDPDSAILDYVKDMEEDEEEYSRLHLTYALLPVNDFEVTAYEAVESSSNRASDLLRQTDAIRRQEGGDGYFQGQMSGSVSGARGVAWLDHKSSFSVPIGWIIAHELGHNLNLRHAPCGNPRPANPDPNFPHDGARIGNWGYDARRNVLQDPDRYRDVMSYCGPQWISDYFFEKAIEYRRSRGYHERRDPSAAVRTILLWGGLDEDGAPFLDPAFVMEARPGLPASSGAYALTGQNEAGQVLFSFSFDMPEVADAPGKASSFAFTLPVQDGWAGALASVTLAGPGGLVTMDGDTDRPMTIARARKDGPIRAFWDGHRNDSAARPGWVLLRSSGIPGREEWER